MPDITGISSPLGSAGLLVLAGSEVVGAVLRPPQHSWVGEVLTSLRPGPVSSSVPGGANLSWPWAAVVLGRTHEDSAVGSDDVGRERLEVLEPLSRLSAVFSAGLGAGLAAEVIKSLVEGVESLAGVVHAVQCGDLTGDAHGHGRVSGMGAHGVAGEAGKGWEAG